MKFRLLLSAIFALAFAAVPAASLAQVAPVPPPYSSIAGAKTLALTTSSARTTLPSTSATFGALTVYNSGTVAAYFAIGSSTVVAATTGTCATGSMTSCYLAPGTFMTVWVGVGNTHIAGITGSSTSTLVIYQATGPVQFGRVVDPSIDGTVTSVAAGTGITATPNPITDTGTIAIDTTVVPRLGVANTFTGLNVISPTISASSGTTGPALSLSSTVNNSGTASHTSLSVAPTLTGLGSGTNLLANFTGGHANLTGQLRIGYDESNYVNILVGSTGATNVSTTGSGSDLILNSGGGILRLRTAGSNRFQVSGNTFSGDTASSFRLTNTAAGASAGFIPNQTAVNASVSASAAGNVTTYASNGTGGAAVNVIDAAYNDVLVTVPFKILSGAAIPAGGTTGAGYRFSSASNFGVFFGSGAPTLSAAKGSLYLRSDGSGVNDRAYINTDGGTTWTALVTVG